MDIAAIRNNKGKFAVLVLYILGVLIYPLFALTPYAQRQLVDLVHSIVPTEDDVFLKEYLTLLRNGDVEKAYSLLAPEAKENVSIDQMRTLTWYFASTTDQMEVVAGGMNSHSSENRSTTTYDVYYEIANNDPRYKFVIAEIIAQNTGSGLVILGVNTAANEKSIKDQPRFDFASQGIYAILALLIPIFIAFTAYRYITKAEKPRWLIFLVILFATLYLTFAGGGVKANFGFNGFMTPTGPWAPFAFLTPIPLGAIYYWIRRKKYESPDSSAPKDIPPRDTV